MNPYAPPQSDPSTPPFYPQPPPARPSTGVKVLAVFQIVLGALGLLSAPLTLALRGIAHDPVSQRIQEITWGGALGVWMRIALAVGTLLSAVLLAAGVGMLRARPWARRASLLYAGVSFAMQAVGVAINFAVLYPAMDYIAREHAGDPIAQAAVAGGRIGGIFGALLALALPITILIVLTRPSVKAQFQE
jgi:hypothetical protein